MIKLCQSSAYARLQLRTTLLKVRMGVPMVDSVPIRDNLRRFLDDKGVGRPYILASDGSELGSLELCVEAPMTHDCKGHLLFSLIFFPPKRYGMDRLALELGWTSTTYHAVRHIPGELNSEAMTFIAALFHLHGAS
jgi:hypothetical protein